MNSETAEKIREKAQVNEKTEHRELRVQYTVVWYFSEPNDSAEAIDIRTGKSVGIVWCTRERALNRAIGKAIKIISQEIFEDTSEEILMDERCQELIMEVIEDERTSIEIQLTRVIQKINEISEIVKKKKLVENIEEGQVIEGFTADVQVNITDGLLREAREKAEKIREQQKEDERQRRARELREALEKLQRFKGRQAKRVKLERGKKGDLVARAEDGRIIIVNGAQNFEEDDFVFIRILREAEKCIIAEVDREMEKLREELPFGVQLALVRGVEEAIEFCEEELKELERR